VNKYYRELALKISLKFSLAMESVLSSYFVDTNPLKLVLSLENLELAGEYLYFQEPDSCEVHLTPHRERDLPI